MSEKFALIDAEKAQYPIVRMCTWLEVSASGFYEWRDRPASATAARRDRLAALIRTIFDDSDQTYGYRRIHAALARQGDHCCPELVREIMRELGLVPCQPRPWRPTTTQPGTGAESIPDLVARDFTAAVPGTKLVGDITYLSTWQGFASLSPSSTAARKSVLVTRSPARRAGHRRATHGRSQPLPRTGSYLPHRSRFPISQPGLR